MPWSTKHHDTCLKNGMRAAAINLAAYVYRRCKSDESTELEIERDKFDRHMVRTRGQAYHRTYFPKIVNELEQLSNGAVVILQDYHRHGVYKLLVRPISFAIENGKTKPETSLGQTSGNPMFPEVHKKRLLDQQQQDKDIETIKSLFDKLGMEWSREALLKIWRMAGKSVNDVKDAIDFMLHANTSQSEPIRKPHGWFIRCMERGEYKLFAHQLLYQLPRFNSKIELMGYMTSHLYGGRIELGGESSAAFEWEASHSKRADAKSRPRDPVPISSGHLTVLGKPQHPCPCQ